jgi:hypothetical protein
MRQPHSKHRWATTVRSADGRALQTCHYRACAETRILDRAGDSRRADARDRKILRAARRIFADVLRGVDDLGL